MAFKDFSPYQKFQYILIWMVPVLFLLCFFREFLGFWAPLPESIKGMFMAFYSIILVLVDAKEIMSLIHQTPNPPPEQLDTGEDKIDKEVVQ